MSALGPLHKQALLSAFSNIHRRLLELEAAIASSDRPNAFVEYQRDLSLEEQEAIQQAFARIRETMAARLQEHGVRLKARRTSLRWVVQSGVSALAVAADELGPRHLKGYGRLSEAARQELLAIQDEMTGHLDRLVASLREEKDLDAPGEAAP